jgi:hypothetical protein
MGCPGAGRVREQSFEVLLLNVVVGVVVACDLLSEVILANFLVTI